MCYNESDNRGDKMKDVSFLTNNGVDVNKSLELFGDISMYNATLPELLKGIEEKVPQLIAYKEAADMKNYAIIVHSLKSDARYFGFMTLGEMAYAHEMKSKENDCDYVYNHLDELMKEVERTVAIVKEYLGQGTGTPIYTSFAPVKKDKKILVVDDSSVVISFVKKIFDQEYEVITAVDGAQALQIIEQEPKGSIAAMLLDIMMPNVNGFGVLEYFKNHSLFQQIPVSIITGAYTKEVIDIVKQYDIVDLLAKPFNEKNVKDVVERTIQRKEVIGA